MFSLTGWISIQFPSSTFVIRPPTIGIELMENCNLDREATKFPKIDRSKKYKPRKDTVEIEKNYAKWLSSMALFYYLCKFYSYIYSYNNFYYLPLRIFTTDVG